MTIRILQLSLIVLILTTSCSVLNFGRKYVDYVVETDNVYSNIRLNNDSTFVYGSGNRMVQWNTEGTWVQKNDKIYLTSIKQREDFDTNSFYILDNRNNLKDYIIIDFMDVDSVSPLVGMTSIVYKDGEMIETDISDFDGRVELTTQIFDSIVCKFISKRDILIYPQGFNYYKIATVESDNNYRFLRNYEMIRKEEYILDENENIKYKKRD